MPFSVTVDPFKMVFEYDGMIIPPLTAFTYTVDGDYFVTKTEHIGKQAIKFPRVRVVSNVEFNVVLGTIESEGRVAGHSVDVISHPKRGGGPSSRRVIGQLAIDIDNRKFIINSIMTDNVMAANILIGKIGFSLGTMRIRHPYAPQHVAEALLAHIAREVISMHNNDPDFPGYMEEVATALAKADSLGLSTVGVEIHHEDLVQKIFDLGSSKSLVYGPKIHLAPTRISKRLLKEKAILIRNDGKICLASNDNMADIILDPSDETCAEIPEPEPGEPYYELPNMWFKLHLGAAVAITSKTADETYDDAWDLYVNVISTATKDPITYNGPTPSGKSRMTALTPPIFVDIETEEGIVSAPIASRLSFTDPSRVGKLAIMEGGYEIALVYDNPKSGGESLSLTSVPLMLIKKYAIRRTQGED